jgi:hypothetical protein
MRPPSQKLEVAQVGNDHYAAIGTVVSNWAVLEVLMASLIWRLANVADYEGACITSQIGNSGRLIAALISLIKLDDASDELIDKYKKFDDKTRKLQDRRNRITHDPWSLDLATSMPHRFEVSARKTLNFEYKPVSTNDVLNIVDEISKLISEFNELAEQTIFKLSASRQKRFESYFAILQSESSKKL